MKEHVGADCGDVFAENYKLSVDAVLFDLDGTLIDSTSIYFKLVHIALDALSLPSVPRKAVAEALKDGDFDWDCILPKELYRPKDKLIQEARAIIYDIAPQLFRKEVGLIPGTAEILYAIAGGGLRIGLVTSTPKQSLALKMEPLKKAGIEGLLEVIVTADDTQYKKPDPEPLIKCSQMLQVSGNRCVYIGDSRVDVRAGKAAGMNTIGVLSGFDDCADLRQENPEAVIDSIAELLEVLAL